jgi:CPA1 family monovalent cation:H+ antiporter
VAGGGLLGLVVANVVCVALREIDDAPLELLLTVALVMGTYSLSFPLHVSGPIAIVVAGLVVGHVGRRVAMTSRTREHVDTFWAMIDELLNIVLFLLLGLQVMTVKAGILEVVAAGLAVPIVLAARLTSVGTAVALVGLRRRQIPGFVPILTWGGLRGGLSVAMVLSLPPFRERDLFLACTYAVVVFSILVQGLTMRRLLTRYGLSDPTARR